MHFQHRIPGTGQVTQYNCAFYACPSVQIVIATAQLRWTGSNHDSVGNASAPQHGAQGKRPRQAQDGKRQPLSRAVDMTGKRSGLIQACFSVMAKSALGFM